jgi:hypothetical protein
VPSRRTMQGQPAAPLWYGADRDLTTRPRQAKASSGAPGDDHGSGHAVLRSAAPTAGITRRDRGAARSDGSTARARWLRVGPGTDPRQPAALPDRGGLRGARRDGRSGGAPSRARRPPAADRVSVGAARARGRIRPRRRDRGHPRQDDPPPPARVRGARGGAPRRRGGQPAVGADQGGRARERGEDAGPRRPLAGVPRALPALQRAWRLQDKAASVGFDWPSIDRGVEQGPRGVGGARPGAPSPAMSITCARSSATCCSCWSATGKSSGSPPRTRCGPPAPSSRPASVRDGRQCHEQGIDPNTAGLAKLDGFWDEAKARGIGRPGPGPAGPAIVGE